MSEVGQAGIANSFVDERDIPMRQGGWSPAYRKINTYEIKHYLVGHFGRIPLAKLVSSCIN